MTKLRITALIINFVGVIVSGVMCLAFIVDHLTSDKDNFTMFLIVVLAMLYFALNTYAIFEEN